MVDKNGMIVTSGWHTLIFFSFVSSIQTVFSGLKRRFKEPLRRSMVDLNISWIARLSAWLGG